MLHLQQVFLLTAWVQAVNGTFLLVLKCCHMTKLSSDASIVADIYSIVHKCNNNCVSTPALDFPSLCFVLQLAVALLRSLGIITDI